MKLATTLKRYGSAEIEIEGTDVVVDRNDEEVSFVVTFSRGAMPPYSVECVDTLEDVQNIIKQSIFADTLKSTGWRAVKYD